MAVKIVFLFCFVFWKVIGPRGREGANILEVDPWSPTMAPEHGSSLCQPRTRYNHRETAVLIFFFCLPSYLVGAILHLNHPRPRLVQTSTQNTYSVEMTAVSVSRWQPEDTVVFSPVRQYMRRGTRRFFPSFYKPDTREKREHSIQRFHLGTDVCTWVVCEHQ